jgi:FtsP/CotA-like multicopper oxidase with cupredoxin domain
VPDLAKLPWVVRDGAKEFHLIAEPVRREFLPHLVMDVWGFNGTTPGPAIEVNEGDRVRIIVENRLPEPTSIHWHSLEIPVSQDGVPGLVQDFIPPGEAFVYEFVLHQNGTFFYHAHVAMQEAMGMVGLFIVHPRTPYEPVVDQDIALITQEFDILPNTTIPNSQGMDFNFLTFNGRCAPMTTPIVVKLGERVRLRFVNFSTADHHPIHLHGHTFWVTGTEGGRIPESAWVPGNNVLVGVAQARDVEFIANNPGDWIMHCHMFHHTMNHMVSMAGPMARVAPGDPRGRVPGYPQNMEGGMRMTIAEDDAARLARREARGMRRDWSHIKGLTTVVRVLPPDLYDKVVSGDEPLPPGSSVFGPRPGRRHPS